jgi:thiosulfate/3-mercaptopyruvate sulfurtransferase
VLAYDEGTGWAARCWWLLRHLGHDRAGTFDRRAYAGALVTDEPHVERAAFVARVRDDDLAEMEEIRARLGDPSLVLVDARARALRTTARPGRRPYPRRPNASSIPAGGA